MWKEDGQKWRRDRLKKSHTEDKTCFIDIHRNRILLPWGFVHRRQVVMPEMGRSLKHLRKCVLLTKILTYDLLPPIPVSLPWQVDCTLADSIAV